MPVVGDVARACRGQSLAVAIRAHGNNGVARPRLIARDTGAGRDHAGAGEGLRQQTGGRGTIKTDLTLFFYTS